jgi:DNA-binding NarL/FixJ family response regulator
VNQPVTRYAPYLWLVYLGALVYQPAFDPDTTAADWVATGMMVAAFLPLYRASLAERDQRRLMFLLAAMAGLGVVGTLVNAGAGVFVVYAAALAGRLSPVRRAVVAVAVLAGLAGVMFLISTVPLPWRLLAVGPIVVFVLVIGAAGIIDGERERTQARLRRADEEIERLATIAERERIARDLHDLLGHTLSVVVLKSELAGRLVRSDPDRAEQEVREVEHTARTALAEVRSAVAGYRAKGLGVELLLTDIEMPGRSGLDVAAEIRRRGLGTRVVILTTFARTGYLRRALDAGVGGYLLKDAPSATLAGAIRTVHHGGRAVDPALAADAWAEADPLTDRERQVLRLAGDGLSNADIAARLHLSDGTVRNYLSEAIRKLGATNRTAAARLAHDRGWL